MDPKYHKGGSSGTQSLKMSKGFNNLGPALHGYFMDQQNCSSMPESIGVLLEHHISQLRCLGNMESDSAYVIV